jgi:hypothetical protein
MKFNMRQNPKLVWAVAYIAGLRCKCACRAGMS